MISRMGLITIFIFASASAGLADHTHKHKRPVTMQMKAQHKTMDVINEEWNAARKLIKAGDLKHADDALKTILEKSSYIEKFEGYHNVEKRTEFLSEHQLFLERVKTLREKLSTKDSAVLAASIQGVQESCSRCHSLFK